MTPQTAAYRAIARVAARTLGRLDGVIGVYARRSVATGEVAFGRSDIDLHILIAPSASAEAEGKLLANLVALYNRMRRLAPVLGHAWVSTRDDLERWYVEQPAEWYRDRAWLRLYGEEFERPRCPQDRPGDEVLLWWYGWAMGALLESFRVGNARRCWNLVLDLFDVYRLRTGLEDGVLDRHELFDLWWSSGKASPERTRIRGAWRRGLRASPGALLAAIYRESLSIHDLLFEHVDQLEGRAAAMLESRVPPLFSGQRYLVTELSDRQGIDRGLALMREDKQVWLLNERGLKIYLAYRNPWEYAVLAATNPGLELAPPSREAFERSLRRALHREVPRTMGFMDEPARAGPQYSQRRLYADSGLVASSLAELRAAYTSRYGNELATNEPVRDYFLRSYPLLCEIIDELRVRTPPFRSPDSGQGNDS
jgi:hypothetical protein